MAPPIVYNNVARVADDDESTLFNGTKFWVHQRVPLRSSIINDITASIFFASSPHRDLC